MTDEQAISGGTEQERISIETAFFWSWFSQHHKELHSIVAQNMDTENRFLKVVANALKRIDAQLCVLVGMKNEDLAELIISSDGHVASIYIAEEIVAQAPTLEGWRFIALKPAVAIKGCQFRDNSYSFGPDKLQFFVIEHPKYPDLIDINIVHQDMNEANKKAITHGTLVYLDSLLGELNLVTQVDQLTVLAPPQEEQTLIPIEKLRSYLRWREAEFVEKYEAQILPQETQTYAFIHSLMFPGIHFMAFMNSNFLKWEHKPSRPWIMRLAIEYKTKRADEMPNEHDLTSLDDVEQTLVKRLNNSNDYLNIGHQTGGKKRELYFACSEFREISRVARGVVSNFGHTFKLHYSIYKDKYWLSLKQFMLPTEE